MVDYRDMTEEERLAKAQKPGKDAMKMHPFYGGKVEVVPKACVRSSMISPFGIRLELQNPVRTS